MGWISKADADAAEAAAVRSGQDEADGAALRRLREALPSHVVTVKADAMAYGSGWLVSAEDGPNSAMYALEATIAEAADKCREALGVHRGSGRRHRGREGGPAR